MAAHQVTFSEGEVERLIAGFMRALLEEQKAGFPSPDPRPENGVALANESQPQQKESQQ